MAFSHVSGKTRYWRMSKREQFGHPVPKAYHDFYIVEFLGGDAWETGDAAIVEIPTAVYRLQVDAILVSIVMQTIFHGTGGVDVTHDGNANYDLCVNALSLQTLLRLQNNLTEQTATGATWALRKSQMLVTLPNIYVPCEEDDTFQLVLEYDAGGSGGGAVLECDYDVRMYFLEK